MRDIVLRTVVVGAFVTLFLPALEGAEAQTLPAGIKRIAFGRAVTTKDPSQGQKCTISEPLPSPIEFMGGVTEISFIIEIDPRRARRVSASVLGDLGSAETKGANCNAYSMCGGAICQTQFGSTVSRLDGKPLKAGAFNLSIEVDGQGAKVPFVIK